MNAYFEKKNHHNIGVPRNHVSPVTLYVFTNYLHDND